MKVSVKSVLGVMISLAWFVAYVGGGAFLLAQQATANPDHVAVYIPLVIFLWIVGFFVGHTAIEKFLLIILPSKNIAQAVVGLPNLADRRNLQALDINNLPTVIASKVDVGGRGLLKPDENISYNNKKDSRKIYVGFIPAKKKILVIQFRFLMPLEEINLCPRH